MGLLIKHSFKNILKRPLRTLAVVFAIFLCSLSALLCMDLGGTVSDLIKLVYSQETGGTDISFVNTGSPLYRGEFPEGFPENDVLEITGTHTYFFRDVSGEYAYAERDSLTIYGMDLDRAAELGVVPSMELGPRETAVTSKFASDFGYEAGDTITYYDLAGDPVVFTITEIVPVSIKNGLMGYGYSAAVDQEAMSDLTLGETVPMIIYIDVKDDSRISEAYDMLTAAYDGAGITNMADSAEMKEIMASLTAGFLLLFVVTFLLVFFVTVSLCEKIIIEKMPFIGTLRSLGMSSGRTTAVLMIENVIYALIGSLPACIFYSVIREPMMHSVLRMESEDGTNLFPDIPPVSALLIIGVIAGAVAIECLLPLREVLRAIRTPIRDIIFDNKDTAYRSSKNGRIAGAGFLLISAACFIFRDNIFLAIGCVICLITALALLFPVILQYASQLLIKAFNACGDVKGAIAAKEVYARKSTVGSTVLCCTASALCVIILSFSTSLLGNISNTVYDCDVMVDYASEGDETAYSYISYLNGVTDIEYRHVQGQDVYIGDSDLSERITFYGIPSGGYKYGGQFDDLDTIPGRGEIAVTRKFARDRSLSVGDTVTMTFYKDTIFPLEKTFTIVSVFDGSNVDMSGMCAVISLQEMDGFMYDTISSILISCSDPDAVASAVNTYSSTLGVQAKTHDQCVEENNKSRGSLIRVITVIILLSAGMTSIGITSNQLAGFEGRKRESAVMISTSMSRSDLGSILFRESLIASVLSVVTGVLTGLFSIITLNPSFIRNDMDIFLTADPRVAAGVAAGLTLIFTLTVLFPLRSLRKMKLSEQLKYE